MSHAVRPPSRRADSVTPFLVIAAGIPAIGGLLYGTAALHVSVGLGLTYLVAQLVGLAITAPRTGGAHLGARPPQERLAVTGAGDDR